MARDTELYAPEHAVESDVAERLDAYRQLLQRPVKDAYVRKAAVTQHGRSDRQRTVTTDLLLRYAAWTYHQMVDISSARRVDGCKEAQ